MTSPARRLGTYAELCALPEGTRAQLIAGEIRVDPAPLPEHQASLLYLASDIMNAFQRGRGGPGGWWILPDVDVAFSAHDVLRPDVAGWRREHVPQLPVERPVTQRPDWVCEILSPSTAAFDRGRKRDAYCSAGVPRYWQVDVLNRTITVLRLTAEGYVDHQTAGDQGSAKLAPFDAIGLDLAELFPPARA